MNVNDNSKVAHSSLPHGGDWASYKIEYGKAPVDFSMNVNPLGMSAAVCDAIAKASTQASQYPDPLCRELRDAIAASEGLPAEWIFCGNGAADVIFRLAKALDQRPCEGPTLLLCAPTFSEYETAFAAEGWQIKRHLLREEQGFLLSEAILSDIDETIKAVFLCEPNNPTGMTTDPALLQQILSRCQETGTFLIIDECFNGFLDESEAHTMKSHVSACDNLIILKAFTKLYGMAGVRLGYCLCRDVTLINALRQAGPPWNVSSLAQSAGIAALQDREHVEGGRSIIRQERPWLLRELHRLGVDKVYGCANYLLFRWEPRAAIQEAEDAKTGDDGQDAKPPAEGQDLQEQLRSRGILIRDCSNYHGLSKGWYRIAVRTHEENVQLIDALDAIIN